jgi:hypothetical protein
MAQGILFPTKIRSTRPAASGTADLKLIGTAFDGQEYAIKQVSDHPLLPASEFFAHRLFPACQLAVPYSVVLEMPDGSLAFGSRWEGGVSLWKDFPGPDQMAVLQEASETVSAIIGVDLFLGNHDRHLGNFLYRRNLTGQWRAIAIDFSRAVFVNGIPMGPMPPAGCNTANAMTVLRQINAWKTAPASLAASAIPGVSQTALGQWFTDMPDSWLDAAQRQVVLSWWGGSDFQQRIAKTLALL